MERRDRKFSRGSDSRDFRPSGGGFNRGGQGMQPREMHKAVCSGCQKECEVPFKPTEGKPVYCRECFASQKPKRF